MRHIHNRTTRNYFILTLFLAMILVYVGVQFAPSENKHLSDVVDSTTTTNTILVEVTTTIEGTTTIPETTTTEVSVVRTTVTIAFVPRTTTTEPFVVTTLPQTSYSSVGPPRNVTTLVGCIAYYESTWGDISSNIFQFEQSTWEAYGGTGRPSNAPYWRQEEVFWLAWEDDGYHHWLAQKGRCF